jgi:hypothetical protein
MNSSRIVAAIAALAIGFGVTIVGINVADDPGDVVATAGSTDSDGEAAEAQQDEAEAEPPPDAEVVDETAAVEQVPQSTNAGNSSQSDDEPPRDSECEQVLVVFTGSGQVLILAIERGEVEEADGDVFVRGSDVTVEEEFRAREVVPVLGVLDDRLGSRSVEDCQSGEFYEATVAVDFEAGDDESVSGEVSGEEESAVPGERFPCSDEAFDSLLDNLGGLEQTALATDADVFVRVIARRLARFGTSSVEAWEVDVRGAFDRFLEADGCSAELEDAFIAGDGAGFFCAAANVSADNRLFVYLDDAVPNLMEGCQYDPEEGVT